MTCYRSHDANGDFVGILCGKFGKPCVECGDVSAVLCDFPIGAIGETCDLPLCERCAPTVGADRNYCKEHRENGPGLLLFRAKPLTEEEMRDRAKKIVEDAEAKRRAKRLPKAPAPNLRWRVVMRDTGAALSAWVSQINAEVFAKKRGGIVQTWEQFAVIWRAEHPTKLDRKAMERASEAHKKTCGGCPKCMPHVQGCAGCPWCTPPPGPSAA